MNVKKCFAFLLALCLLAPCFAAVPAAAADEGTVLYQQLTPGDSKELAKIWPTNTTQSWLRGCVLDGTTFRQIDFYNNRNASGGLPEGETLRFDVMNAEIPTRGFAEVVLSLQYALCLSNSDTDIIQTDRFQVYASTDGGQTWSSGYAGMASSEFLGAGTTTNNLEAMVFRVESTDLSTLVPKGATINALRIRPFGDYAIHYGATRIHGISVTGYTTARSAAQDTEVAPIPVAEDVLRQIVVQTMYDIVDKPWTTDTEIITYNSEGYQDEAHTQYYKPGWQYRGPTYTRRVNINTETFFASIDGAGRYHGGIDDNTALGMDCIEIVSNGLSPISNARHDSWSYAPLDSHLKILGGLKEDKRNEGTIAVIKDNGDDAILESYTYLQPGDYVLSQKGTASDHVRLVTKPSKIVRFSNGKLDPTRSCLYLSETKGAVEYYWEKPDGGIVATSDKDPAAYQQAHPTYKYLYGSSCRKDKEYNFAEILLSNYLPYSPEEYALGQVKGVALSVVGVPEAAAVRTTPFQPNISSNWQMIQVEVALTDMNTGARVWRDVYRPDTGTYTLAYKNEDLDAAMRFLPNGAYELTLDVTAGPVTEVGGSRPVTRLAQLDFSVGGAAIPAAVKTLNTAGADGWAVDWLNKAFTRGLLGELNQSGFTKDVTRLQFADMAVRLAEVVTGKEIDPAAADSFTDTTETAILKAKAAGISAGYEKDGKYEFRPQNPITRQEICVMLDHVAVYAAEQQSKDGLPDFAEIAEKFIDRAEVADWAKKQVARMTGNAVMGGKATAKGDAITPQANTTLQEAVTLAIKLDDMLSIILK